MSKYRFTRILSAGPHHLRRATVSVELDVSSGSYSYSIVGLPDKAVEESRDRVDSALRNSGFPSPKKANHKTVISLAPADIKKEGSFFDVAIAMGYLSSIQEIDIKDSDSILFVGELGLDGSVKPVRGILPIAKAAQETGIANLFVPEDNAAMANLIDGITVYGIKHLRDLVWHFSDNHSFTIQATNKTPQKHADKKYPDFSHIKRQATAKRALTIAAAGNHNIAMFGPPGTGKSMLAKAFTGILPNLDPGTSLAVTGIHSIAGVADNIIVQPPFRSPHHTSSYVSIIGGGASIKPGEITLAHGGVLFLDEFPEFEKRVLESLRQPIEDKQVTISRAKDKAIFPSDFILVAALNPCPCGFLTSDKKQCICSQSDIARYRRKLSGPIVDRIDLWVDVEHVPYKDLTEKSSNSSQSQELRRIVSEARTRQKQRLGSLDSKATKNSAMSVADIVNLDIPDDTKELLEKSAATLALSPRVYHKIIKISQTIADLESSDTIKQHHVLEALQYRPGKLLD